jgi:hypothetical protein
MTTVNAAVAIQKNASAVLEMFDLFEEFATDSVLEVEGAWHTYRGATRLKIARANNDEYGKALTAALDEHREALTAGDAAADELSKRLMNEIMAKTILKGWENVKIKGVITEYTPEVGAQMLAHNDFRLYVKRVSEDRELFKLKLVEEAAKN